jgi:small subunit ribosomal protein S1
MDPRPEEASQRPSADEPRTDPGAEAAEPAVNGHADSDAAEVSEPRTDGTAVEAASSVSPVSEPAAPEPVAPEPAAAEAPVPESPAPEPAAAEAPVPESPAPEPVAPEPAAAEAAGSGSPSNPDAMSTASDDAFSRLLADPTEQKRRTITPKKGSRVTGKIVQLSEKGAFVDFGGREEGFVDIQQLRNEKGEVTRKVGDEIRATVSSVEGGTKLTLKAKRSGNLPAVIDAHRSGLPVEGRVTGVNKGGLVVRIMGVRAFCPFSQIDRRYIEDPSVYVGKRLTFRVTAADAKGKNIVLSRRVLLEEQIRGHAETLRKDLEVGKELSGVVARVRPFGVFVDLGGVDGLVHLSEISHTRVKDPSEVLKVGQDVRVKVMKIEDLGGKKERISLSIKELLDDPWDELSSKLVVGEKVEGKVVRIVDFGAFLEIAPGIDGLIHVSALAAGRVTHPSDIVSVGDAVPAWVVNVDRDSRRISLSLIDPQAAKPAPRSEGKTGRSGGGRKEAREVREHRETRKPEGGMTSMEEAFQRLRDQNDQN